MLSVRYILVEAEQHDPGGNERRNSPLRRPGVAMAQAQVEESTEQTTSVIYETFRLQMLGSTVGLLLVDH